MYIFDPCVTYRLYLAFLSQERDFVSAIVGAVVSAIPKSNHRNGSHILLRFLFELDRQQICDLRSGDKREWKKAVDAVRQCFLVPSDIRGGEKIEVLKAPTRLRRQFEKFFGSDGYSEPRFFVFDAIAERGRK
jgi:hypothetical protein